MRIESHWWGNENRKGISEVEENELDFKAMERFMISIMETVFSMSDDDIDNIIDSLEKIQFEEGVL